MADLILMADLRAWHPIAQPQLRSWPRTWWHHVPIGRARQELPWVTSPSVWLDTEEMNCPQKCLWITSARLEASVALCHIPEPGSQKNLSVPSHGGTVELSGVLLLTYKEPK